MLNFRNELEVELFQHIIPFWKNLKDEIFGGYYGYMNFDLQIDKNYDKGCILNSRILWFFSNAFLQYGDKELLSYADWAYYFFVNHCLDREYGGVYWSVTYDGKISDSTKYTYNHAFAVYALSSYYDATKNGKVIDLALELFHLIENACVDEYGYLESFTREWNFEPNDKLSENGLLADKTMNTLLHLLEAYTELYRVSRNEEVKQALEKILFLFKKKVYNQKTHRLEVFFDQKMNSISDLYSFGHDIEATWLLDRACDVLGDEKITAETREYTTQIVREVYENALDNGSMNNESFNGVVDDTKVWWIQAEAMVGFINSYQRTGEKRFFDTALEIWDYIKRYMIDKREGSEWFWDLNREGEPESKKPIVEPWKCPYHNGRMCLEITRRLKI